MDFFVKWTSEIVEGCFTMGLGYYSWSSACPWTTSESPLSKGWFLFRDPISFLCSIFSIVCEAMWWGPWWF